MSKDSVKRLTLRGHVHSWSGFGIVGCEIFRGLRARGIHVSIRAMAQDEKFGSKIPLEMRAAIVQEQQPEDYEMLVHTPEQHPTPGKKTAFFTMFECSELDEKYVRALNRAEIVIVPNRWNQKCFKESGVTRPIHVVPLGVDTNTFTPTPIVKSGPCVFGVSGRTAHCATRKGIQAAIDLFLRTFPTEPDARLHLKLHDDCHVNKITDSRIKVIREHLEPYALAHWLRGLTAFVSLARAEGWGMLQHEAMACGRPVLACQYGGLAEFLLADFAIPFREGPADSHGSVVNVNYKGSWAIPNEVEAGKLMRRIYAMHRTGSVELQAAGQRAAEAAAKFSWDNSTDKLVAVLKKVGAL